MALFVSMVSMRIIVNIFMSLVVQTTGTTKMLTV